MHGISETSMYICTDRFICFEGGTRIKVKKVFLTGSHFKDQSNHIFL